MRLGSRSWLPARSRVRHAGCRVPRRISTWSSILRKNRPFSRDEFARRMKMTILGVPAFVASPEDTIVAKLEWSKQSGGSERQRRDVAGIVANAGSTLDRVYIDVGCGTSISRASGRPPRRRRSSAWAGSNSGTSESSRGDDRHRRLHGRRRWRLDAPSVRHVRRRTGRAVAIERAPLRVAAVTAAVAFELVEEQVHRSDGGGGPPLQ
jgi:hypothetical protein